MLRSAYTPIRRLAAATLLTAAFAVPAMAETSSTSTGQVSVAQVMDALDRSGSEDKAKQLLTAYLAGLGETAGIMLSATNAEGKPYVTCERAMVLDDKLVRVVLKKAAPDKARWTETAATPLIVSALVSRAGCR